MQNRIGQPTLKATTRRAETWECSMAMLSGDHSMTCSRDQMPRCVPFRSFGGNQDFSEPALKTGNACDGAVRRLVFGTGELRLAILENMIMKQRIGRLLVL